MDFPEPLPPVMKTSSPDRKLKSTGPTLNTVSVDLLDIAEDDVAHLDLLEPRRGFAASTCASATVAEQRASRRSMLSAAAFAADKMGIDCTRPKHAPITNTSAVTVFAMDAPPSVSLSTGTANTMAPSMAYIELCSNTMRLKVSACVRILMLAAVLDTSIISLIQIFAARAVEPHFFEAVQEVHQPIEQPIFPFAMPRASPRRVDGSCEWNSAAATPTMMTLSAKAKRDR